MKTRVLAVLAGDRVSQNLLKSWLNEADFIVAADGGADLVMEAGFQPDLVVGDLDSASVKSLENAKKVLKTPDQDFSDCQKLLSTVHDLGVRELVICGLEGTRVDHSIHTIQSVANWPGTCFLAYEEMLGKVLKGPETIAIQGEGTVSALPLNGCLGVTMSGVAWPMEKARMNPEGFVSISNESYGSAEISLEEGRLLVLWQYDGKPFWPRNGLS